MLINENLLVPEASDVEWEVSLRCEELPLSETDSEYVQSRVDREWISPLAQPQQASGRQLGSLVELTHESLPWRENAENPYLG